MRWLLDDGPFGHLAKVLRHGMDRAWMPGVLVVPGTTADAATRHASAPGQALLDRVVDGEPLIGRASVVFGSDDPAATILAEFHSNASVTTDLAEREAIAWALVHDREAIFVTTDRRAALTALAELGVGRVAHAFDVWIDLMDRRWIDGDQFEKLCLLTRGHDQGLERMPGRIIHRLGAGGE